MLPIVWNKVTWYSQAAALVIFVGCFVIAFALGVRWEKTHLEATLAVHSAVTTTAPTKSHGDNPSVVGNVMLPSWVGDMVVVTPQSNGTTIALRKNERFAIRLGSELDWTLVFSPASGITRVAHSTTADGFQGVYEAAQTGTTTLMATGKPVCTAQQACPQYLVEDNVTFVVR